VISRPASLAVTQLTTGTRGSDTRMRATVRAYSSSMGCISGEWNA
jgi:hypothetical protein